jgi:hypothetical protein
MFDIVLQRARARSSSFPQSLEDPSPMSFFGRSHNLLGDDLLLNSPALFTDTFGPLGVNTPVSSAFLSMVEEAGKSHAHDDAAIGQEKEAEVVQPAPENKRKRNYEDDYHSQPVKKLKTTIEDVSSLTAEEAAALVSEDFIDTNLVMQALQHEGMPQNLLFDANNIKLLQVILQNPYLTSLAQQQVPQSQATLSPPSPTLSSSPSTPTRKRKNKGDPSARQLVCNGTIKRKNKKSHPGDAFQLKFKLK